MKRRYVDIMGAKTHISVIIPAHNEEKYIKRCIDSIKAADSVFPGNTEIIVVCNRCTDRTEHIAEENGAVTIINEDRCIAKVRNAGIAAAKCRQPYDEEYASGGIFTPPEWPVYRWRCSDSV